MIEEEMLKVNIVNVLQKALADIKFVIPKAILNTVFIDRKSSWKIQVPSLDEQILNSVVRPRVLVDCNLVGGHEITVPLTGVTPQEIDSSSVVYRIPKELTQNRSIVSVLNITYVDINSLASSAYFGACGVTAEQSAAQAMLDAVSPMPMIATTRVSLIGENVVLLRDSIRTPSNAYLRCIIGYDESMSHLQPRSYRSFAKLVEYAVKSYIYNEYIVEMDMGELRGGHNLGKFKDVIEGYSDSEELYDTFFRERWQKIDFQNDRESMNRFVKLIAGGPR